MSKPLHIKFLELFKDKAIGQYVDISDFITDNFQHIGKSNYITPLNFKGPDAFLNDLIEKGLVKSESDVGEWKYTFINDRWVPELPPDPVSVVYFYVTSAGIDYLENYRRSEIASELNYSLKNVNQASVRSYKTQTLLSIITISLALTSALIALFSYFKTDETAKSVDRLRQELHLEIKLQNIQKFQASSGRANPHK